MDYLMVPWGNAYYNTSKCGSGSFDKDKMYCWIGECGVESPPEDCFKGPEICQHGEDECKADLIEACTIGLNPDVAAYGPFVGCFEGVHQSIPSAAKGCAESVGLDFDAIAACVSGPAGQAYNTANAKRTAAVGTGRKGTPWVVVNGQALEDPDTLLSAVCDAYTGTKPAGCRQAAMHVSHPVHVAC